MILAMAMIMEGDDARLWKSQWQFRCEGLSNSRWRDRSRVRQRAGLPVRRRQHRIRASQKDAALGARRSRPEYLHQPRSARRLCRATALSGLPAVGALIDRKST